MDLRDKKAIEECRIVPFKGLIFVWDSATQMEKL